MSLLLLLVSMFSFSACNRYLDPGRFFSEYATAKAIEELGLIEGKIFTAVLWSVPNKKIRDKYNISNEDIERIAHKGIDIMLKLKREGL